MKKTLLAVSTIVLLSSCQRGCARWNKRNQFTERNYEVIMFSGGDTVFVDHFKGIVNNNEKSDGVYYYNTNGDLIEISGDYIIKSN